jgi:hypothetical protein
MVLAGCGSGDGAERPALSARHHQDAEQAHGEPADPGEQREEVAVDELGEREAAQRAGREQQHERPRGHGVAAAVEAVGGDAEGAHEEQQPLLEGPEHGRERVEGDDLPRGRGRAVVVVVVVVGRVVAVAAEEELGLAGLAVAAAALAPLAPLLHGVGLDDGRGLVPRDGRGRGRLLVRRLRHDERAAVAPGEVGEPGPERELGPRDAVVPPVEAVDEAQRAEDADPAGDPRRDLARAQPRDERERAPRGPLPGDEARRPDVEHLAAVLDELHELVEVVPDRLGPARRATGEAPADPRARSVASTSSRPRFGTRRVPSSRRTLKSRRVPRGPRREGLRVDVCGVAASVHGEAAHLAEVAARRRVGQLEEDFLVRRHGPEQGQRDGPRGADLRGTAAAVSRPNVPVHRCFK